ncbi:unnamed protein product [Kluyveromyces dobzhanskii CBS 2104]|uniref:WGS project CCBQ000000000 data, contig 00106 n=1 Tax=Kluyveromyces dobzhanskii CBS 2104 TaxID=1427455 RepID=A0A0A8L7T0_9SACH|nr:unnamed protein product [Kluyveromyces dobzhanskii CBS 2104]
MSGPNEQPTDGGADRGGTEAGENGTEGPSRSHFTIAINYATLSGNDEQAGNDGANTAFTPMILRFADVPSDTSSGRLNEVIALASEYIFQTLTRDQRRHRGLTKEAFEKLEVKATDAVNEKTCAICYDDLINDPKDFNGSSTKRTRADGEGLSSPSSKRQHTEEAEDVTNSNGIPENETANANTSSTGTVPPDQGPSQQNRNEEEEEESIYGHSATVLPCGHVFGRECLYKWTTEHNNCPICRALILSEEELQALHSRDDEFSRRTGGSDNAQQSTFESIRRLLYERSPEPTTANTTQDHILGNSSAETNTASAVTSNQTDESLATDNSNTNENRQQPESAQDITNNTNNQLRTFSTSFIFFLSDPNAQPPNAVTTPTIPIPGTPAVQAMPTATAHTDTSLEDTSNGREAVTQPNANVAPVNSNDANATQANGGTQTPIITHFNNLPEENQRLLGSIRAILRRAHEERSNEQTNIESNTSTNTNNENGERNRHGGHDFAQTTRRFFNLLPLLGRRQHNQTRDPSTPLNTQPPPANPHTDSAIENRYSAYLDHLTTLRNGNRPPSEANSSRFRLPSFFRLGRQAAPHRHEGGNRSATPLSNPAVDPLLSPGLFSSGVASFRHANGVQTVNFTGDIPEPPNQNNEAVSNSTTVENHAQQTPNDNTTNTGENTTEHLENADNSVQPADQETGNGSRTDDTDSTHP